MKTTKVKAVKMTGKELKQARLDMSLTQSELAWLLGFSREMVGLMERGIRPVHPRTVLALQAIRRGGRI